MKAELLVRRRVSLSDDAYAELVVWKVPAPVKGSGHPYKYRLAYVADEVCLLRYDNEAGKGDHLHIGDAERPYAFTTIDDLLSDFMRHIRELRHENAEDQDREP